MPDEPDNGNDVATQTEEEDLGPEDNEEASSQEARSYYYDDAHGYENFDPNSEDDEDTDD